MLLAGRALLLSSSLLLLFVSGTGCAAAGDEDDDASSADQDVTASFAGYYRMRGGQSFGLDRWIEEINLHADGSYEGNFGNDVSNLSGHHYRDAGSYRVETKNGTTTISFDGDPYEVRRKGAGLELRFVGAGWSNQPWFSMPKQPAPATLTFAADGSAKASGPLPAGGTVLVLYAAARVHCASPDRGFFAGTWSVDGGASGWLDWGLAGPAKGAYRALVEVPSAGHDFAIWFHDTDGHACDHWDSAFGKNYHFPIAR